MFITVVNGQIANYYPSIVEVVNSMKELDPFAASYVGVFEYVGNGNEAIRESQQISGCCETGEGITPANLDKYRHKIGTIL